MTRYQLTELRPNGYGRRLWTERLSTASDVVYEFGGRWRIERQYRDAGSRWHRDGGRQPVWEQEYTVP